MLKYGLIQVPSWILLYLIFLLFRQWVDLPGWLVWGMIAFWVSKDVILFFFVWRAYDNSGHSFVGMEGIAETSLAPSGYVRINNELWRAEVLKENTPIRKGEVVWIQEVRGLTLLVVPNSKQSVACN